MGIGAGPQPTGGHAAPIWPIGGPMGWPIGEPIGIPMGGTEGCQQIPRSAKASMTRETVASTVARVTNLFIVGLITSWDGLLG